MTKERMDQIRYRAYKVRAAVEQLATDEYNEHSEGFNCPSTLSGFCARASAMLSWELDRVGISNKIVYSSGHLYIECEGYVVDVTATQFDSKFGRTLIRPQFYMAKWSGCWWRTTKKFNTVRRAMRWQEKNSWPIEQMIQDSDLEYL